MTTEISIKCLLRRSARRQPSRDLRAASTKVYPKMHRIGPEAYGSSGALGVTTMPSRLSRDRWFVFLLKQRVRSYSTKGPAVALACSSLSANTQSKYFSASGQGAPDFHRVRNTFDTSTTLGLL